MQRREFLNATGLLVGAGAVAACRARAAPAGALPVRPVGALDWGAVKAEFAGLAPGLVHMAGFFLASHPQTVQAAIDAHRRGLDASPYEYVEHNAARCESGVRAIAAEYLGCQPNDLAMTDSTTMGLGIVYGGLRLAPGQEILSTTHDHIVTEIACADRAKRTGAPFRQVPLYDDPAAASEAEIAERLRRALRPETRIVAVTWVHSGTGVKLPIRALADVVARANAGRAESDRLLLCVDGVHGFGIEEVGIAELGCDVFVAGCHKWLFGPRGTGLVYATPSGWAATGPTIPTFDPMWRSEDLEHMPAAAFMTPGGFHSFEHRWALEPAFRFHLELGKAKVAARIHHLNRWLKEELARLPRVRVATPMSDALSAGIICIDIDGVAPARAVAELRARGIVASVTPPFYRPAYLRLAPGLLTVEPDVDAALRAVRAIAT